MPYIGLGLQIWGLQSQHRQELQPILIEIHALTYSFDASHAELAPSALWFLRIILSQWRNRNIPIWLRWSRNIWSHTFTTADIFPQPCTSAIKSFPYLHLQRPTDGFEESETIKRGLRPSNTGTKWVVLFRNRRIHQRFCRCDQSECWLVITRFIGAAKVPETTTGANLHAAPLTATTTTAPLLSAKVNRGRVAKHCTFYFNGFNLTKIANLVFWFWINWLPLLSLTKI